jgi:hypothetical protein
MRGQEIESMNLRGNMERINELRAILEAFEVVFKLVKGSSWSPESFESVTHTLATIATIAKSIEDQIQQLELTAGQYKIAADTWKDMTGEDIHG